MTHDEFYEKRCKPMFENAAEMRQKILQEIQLLSRRLFQDNGTESIQSRLNRHERTIRLWCWIIGIIGATALTAVVKQLMEYFVGGS